MEICHPLTKPCTIRFMKTITLDIERFAYGGVSIGRHNRKVVMVRGAVLPGEQVEAVIEKDRDDYFEASLVRVLKASSERIIPFCEYFGICGGCAYQHMPHDLQVRLKESVLKDCLERIAKLDAGLSETMLSPLTLHYRMRAQFKVAVDGIGFHKKRTRDIIAIDHCPLLTEDINASIQNLAPLLSKTGSTEVHVTGNGSLVAQVIAARRAVSRKDAEKIAADLMQYGLSGVTFVLGDQEPLDFGETRVLFDLCGLAYAVSPLSFIQGNWQLNRRVVDMVRRSLAPLHGMKILDLYAGAGNFSLPLAEESDVTAVEGNLYAVKDGVKNLKMNTISSCRFVNEPAELFQIRERFDIVLLDPPRPGITNKVMRNVLKGKPERIVYVSCNPATFARDLKKFLSVYDIESVRMIDFFPQTFHIESVAFLRLR
jgi:23S rRNA (uracil1939-C5)-methyltransferase